MGLFDGLKQSKVSYTYTNEELDAMIADKKQEIENLKKEIEVIKDSAIGVENKHAEKVKALEDKQAYFAQEIQKQKDKINEELSKLENKQENYKTDFNKQELKINEKIQELKTKQAELLASQNEVSKAEFEKQKKRIEKQIEDLKENRNQQNDSLNLKIEEAKTKYAAVLAKKQDEIEAIEQKRNIFVSQAREEIEHLEHEKREIENNHKDALRKIEQNNRDILEDTRKKEENILREKRNEYNDFSSEAKSLTTLRNNLLSELDTKKLSSEHEYETLQTKYNNEQTKLLKDNELLKSNLDDQQRKLKEQVEAHKADYEEKVNELNALIEILNTRQVDSTKDFDNQIEATESSIKEKFRDFVASLEKKYETEAKLREEELASLKYQIAQEEEQLENDRRFLSAKFENDSDICKKNLQDCTARIKDAQNNLTELEKQHNDMVSKYNDQIEELKANNASTIASKVKEYDLNVEKYKKDYANKRKEINTNIADVKNTIDTLNSEIDKIRKEYSELSESSDRRKQSFVSEQEAYLKNANATKDELTSKISDIKNLMSENQTRHNSELEQIIARKNEIRDKSDEQLAALKKEFSDRITELNTTHNRQMEDAKQSYEQKVDILRKKYDEKTSKATSSLEAKKREYEDASTNLKIKLNELKDDTNAKIQALDAQRGNVLNSIDNLRAAMASEQSKYDDEVKELERVHIAKLDELAKKQYENIQKIIAEYETVPNKELIQIKDTYNAKQKEYRESLANMAALRKDIDEQEKSIRNRYSIQKESIDSEVSARSAELSRVKAEAEKLEADHNTQLIKKQQELEAYKNEIASKIQRYKEDSAAEAELRAKELNDELNVTQSKYSKSEESISKQLKDEYTNLENSLNSKQANLDSLISEIESRKTNAENEYNEKYNEVLRKTEDTRNTLSVLEKDHREKVAANSQSISKIKADNAQIITDKNKEYESILAATKEEYFEKRKEINATIAELKNDIANITSEMAKANKDFEEYNAASEKKREEILVEKDAYLKNANAVKDELIEKINNYKSLMAQNQRNYDANAKELNTLRANTQAEYENRIAEIKKELATKIAGLNEKQSASIAEIKSSYENKIYEVKKNFEDKAARIRKDYEAKKKEYEDARDTIKAKLTSIRQAGESKINALNAQRTNLLDSVDNLKSTMDKEQVKYEETVKSLEKEHSDKLAEMARIQTETIQKIINDNGTIPSRQLQEIREEKISKQKELAELNLKIVDKKKLVDDQEKDVHNKAQIQKDTIDSEVAATNSQYDAIKAESEKLDIELRNDVAKRQEELEEYKKRTKAQVKLLNDQSLAEYNSLAQQLKEELSSINTEYTQKQEEQQRLYAEEYATIKQDLDDKKANLDSLIAEINTRQEALKDDYAAKYDEAVVMANDARAILVTLENEHAQKVQGFRNNISQIKNQNDIAIAAKKREYQDVIDETVQDYKQRHESIDISIANVQDEISNIENQIEAANNDFDEYAKASEKRNEIALQDRDAYIKNANDAKEDVSNRIESVRALMVERQQQHNVEVEKINLKQAETKRNYDNSVADLKEAFAFKQKDLNSKHEKLMANAKDEHERKLFDIKNDFEKQVQEIKDAYESRKQEYQYAKKNSKSVLDSIRDEAVAKIDGLVKQRKDLLGTISNLKAAMAEEQDKYDEDVKELEAQHQANLQEMAVQQQQQLASIVELNENEPRRQLEAVTADFEAIKKDYNNSLNIIAEKKQEVDKREADIKAKCKLQKENAANELAIKNSEYARMDEESKKQFEELTMSLNSHQDELEKYKINSAQLLKQIEDERDNDYNNYVKDLDEKYKNALAYYQSKQESTKRDYDSQVDEVREEYGNKQAKVDALINEINAKKDLTRSKYDEEYQVKFAEYDKQIKEINETIANIEQDRAQKNEFYVNSLEKFASDNNIALMDKKAEYQAEITQANIEYPQRKQAIMESIAQVKADIESINKQIVEANNELGEYQKASEDRNQAVMNERNEYLKNTSNIKEDLINKIDALKEKVNAFSTDLGSKIDEVVAKQNVQKEEYEAMVEEIKQKYEEKAKEISESHSQLMAEAKAKHDDILNTLKQQYDDRANEIRETYANKKKEYKYLKANIKDELKAIKDEADEKLDVVIGQRNDLLATINDLKSAMSKELSDYNEQVKQLEAQHEAKLEEMAEQQAKDLKEITEQYENIPNQELQEIREEYNATQKDYNANAAQIALRKQQIDELEKDVRNKCQIQRDTADNELAIKTSEYEKIKDESKRQEIDLNNELIKHQQQLESYKTEMGIELQKIEDKKNLEADAYNKELDEQYNKVQQEYREKEDIVSRQYDEEIGNLKADLDSKQANIQSLINEINSRKAATEQDCIAKYNNAADITNKLQQELDELVNANELKKSELSKSMSQKKEQHYAEIRNIKENYKNVLAEKKQSYEEYIKEIRKKCDEIRNNIANLDKQKEIENAKLETYVNEKNTAFAEVERETSTYVKNITGKINAMLEQRTALEDVHANRIASIKSQIAETMSEYDDLLSSKPQIIADATNEKVDLTERAKLFSKRLKTLEEAHKNILTELDNKRNETIEKIRNDITDLEAGKSDKLKSYEDEITTLSLAYDAMLRDEQAKQDNLTAQIAKATETQKKFVEDSRNQEFTEDSEHESNKMQLSQKHQQDLDASAAEFARISGNFNKEFDDLTKQHSSLSQYLSEMATRYANVDTEINEAKTTLQKECNDKLVEMSKMFEEVQKSKKEKLTLLDVMSSSDVDDVFKA